MQRSLIVALVVCLLGVFAVPAYANTSHQNPPPVAARAENSGPAHTPRPGTESDIKRYVARQVASPNAKNYRGGDVVVISAGTAALVLIIVLLIILI